MNHTSTVRFVAVVLGNMCQNWPFILTAGRGRQVSVIHGRFKKEIRWGDSEVTAVYRMTAVYR